MHSPLVIIVIAAAVNGIGGAGFYPANTTAVMAVSPGRAFGTASGLLRTFSNVGMVFSFAVAVLVAARSISKRTAFQIFVGTTSLPHHLRSTFNSGLHAAFYSSMAFLVVATVLSAGRLLHRRLGPPATRADQRGGGGQGRLSSGRYGRRACPS